MRTESRQPPPFDDNRKPYIDNPIGRIEVAFNVSPSLYGMVQVYWFARWWLDNGVDHMNEVTLRRARLVLRWVTVSMYVRNHPLRPTQPPILSGTGNEYRLGIIGSTLTVRLASN